MAEPQPEVGAGQVDPQRLDPLPELPPDQVSSFRKFLRGRRRPLLALLAAAVVIAFVLVVLPQVSGLGHTFQRLRRGNKSWLGICLGFEALSLMGYIALLRTVLSCHADRVGWSASYQVTMAGTVATKLFAAAGAGGVALTAWALRAAGLSSTAVARRMACFQILLYSVFMGSLVVFGLGLATGLLPGSAPLLLTVVPAVIGLIVILLVASLIWLPADLDARLADTTLTNHLSPRLRRVVIKLTAVPHTIAEGVRTAVEVVSTPRLGLLGALAYWGFDIATLWGAFHAFGAAPEFAVVVMAYFLGMLGNAIPLPGGVGGVEGGMIGAFIAFGVSGSTAILAVLAYRAISFWLPTLPGIAAYFQLRRTVARWRAREEAPASNG
jgi:uncharacterized protein (TIRG00374 family)